MNRKFDIAVIVAILVAFLAPFGAVLSAQSDVTAADIDRLQVAVDDAARDVSALRGRDSALAASLETELNEARDEAVYMRVKLRRSEPLTRNDYWALRDKIDDIRTRARNGASGTSAPVAPTVSTAKPSAPASTDDVPVGTEFDVRLQTALGSKTSKVEDRFEATTLVDLLQGARVIVPAGSVMRGVISSVDPAGRVDRRGSLTVAFDQVTIQGRAYPLRATVTQAIESEGVRGEAGRIGAGAGVGAIIGGILGGFRGALAGILIGGGGTIAATEGNDVELPVGTVLRVRLDTALNLR
jgi:hypothetical protein